MRDAYGRLRQRIFSKLLKNAIALLLPNNFIPTYCSAAEITQQLTKGKKLSPYAFCLLPSVFCLLALNYGW